MALAVQEAHVKTGVASVATVGSHEKGDLATMDFVAK
jgi:hypothetical protein